VQEGIMLGHKVSEKGIEVDKAKVDMASNMPMLSSTKQVIYFLGHASFYRIGTKYFSKCYLYSYLYLLKRAHRIKYLLKKFKQ